MTSLVPIFIKHVKIPFSNTVSSFLCCVLVVKVQAFHAIVWGSNPSDDYFTLLSQSFFFLSFFLYG